MAKISDFFPYLKKESKSCFSDSFHVRQQMIESKMRLVDQVDNYVTREKQCGNNIVLLQQLNAVVRS